jgi:hypothetical protein
LRRRGGTVDTSPSAYPIKDAEIVVEIKDEDYGGRGFTCRDIEGHLWNFCTYDPWDTQSA